MIRTERENIGSAALPQSPKAPQSPTKGVVIVYDCPLAPFHPTNPLLPTVYTPKTLGLIEIIIYHVNPWFRRLPNYRALPSYYRKKKNLNRNKIFFLGGRSQIAIIFPPAAAFFITGCGCDLLINICLTM